MSKLTWNEVGERRFEAGVDRGVLYIDDVGVPWNGLTSVEESPSGGEPTPYYLDGVKFLNVSSLEEFEATINAFYSPPEFDACDGTLQLADGLGITGQKRKAFGLCYRTRVGNDLEGASYGYKLHLVYNALASPSNHSHASIGSTVDPGDLSWKITTSSVSIPTYRPTSHVIIDSTKTSPSLMALLEQNLYGTDTTEPTILYPTRLVELFSDYGILDITIISDGVYAAQGWAVETLGGGVFALDYQTVSLIADGIFQVNGVDNNPVDANEAQITATDDALYIDLKPSSSDLPSFVYNIGGSPYYDPDGTGVSLDITLIDGLPYVNLDGMTGDLSVEPSDDDYVVEGASVEIIDDYTFIMDSPDVVDNGDGSLTIN